MIKKLKYKIICMKKYSTKTSVFVYFILRFLVITCMIFAFIRGDLNNAFLCLITFILLFIPMFIKQKFKIELPNLLEIIILLFIYAAAILGEINNFYITIPYWDSILHTINGFIAAGIGLSLIDLLNKNTCIKLSPIFICLVSFCFSMTIGVFWEFYEYTSDNLLFQTDMQKDHYVTKINSVILNENKKNIPIHLKNITKTEIKYFDEFNNTTQITIDNGYIDVGLYDTMKDLFVNFIGALLFNIFGYFYFHNQDKFTFLKNFIVKRQELPN